MGVVGHATNVGRSSNEPNRARPLDYFGIAVFAISGALVAAERGSTSSPSSFSPWSPGSAAAPFAISLIGAPVFWVHTNSTLLICIAAALLVWIAS